MKLLTLLLLATIAIRRSDGFQVPSALQWKKFSSLKYAKIHQSHNHRLKTPCRNSQTASGSNSRSKQRRSLPFLKRKSLLFIGSALSWFLLLGTKASWAAATADAVAAIPEVAAKSIAPQISAAAELQLIMRLIFAAVSGSVVGWERSSSKHSAGVRTMALVSLGAASFTICSAYGFAGKCDPSRMAANVASGVGFLGAGVITTQARATKTESYNIVHGLTTAAAIWLSAALGVASGVGLYLTSFATTLTTIAILRLGKAPGKKEDERVSDHIRPKNKKKKKKVEEEVEYDLSDTHDTMSWDEVQEALQPPGPLGDSIATSFRKPQNMMPNDWLSSRFENQTIGIPEPVMMDDDFPVFQRNFTNATYNP